MHDPERQAQMAAARVKGGKGKGRLARVERLVPSTLKPVLSRLLEALEEVHTEGLSPAQAQAMASLAGAIVRVYQVGTLEERLSALEHAYGQEQEWRAAR